MAISPRDAEKIHKIAQNAGISDETLEQWTEETGGYCFAITHHTGTLKAGQADEVRARIRKHVADVEQAVLAEAAKAAGVTAPPPPGTPMATDRQVDYIMSLLERRERNGDGGGFMTGPTDRAGVEQMTKAEASAYITSLKEDY